MASLDTSSDTLLNSVDAVLAELLAIVGLAVNFRRSPTPIRFDMLLQARTSTANSPGQVEGRCTGR